MIVSLGDLLLDVIVRLRQPLAEGADADATTRLGPGGQAANVAAWVAELGGRARFVGKRARRRSGRDRGRAASRAYGVEVRGPLVDGRTGHDRLARRRGRRRARWPPTAASRPTSAPRSSTRRGWTAAPTSTSPATRSCARRSTRPRSAPQSSRRASRVDLSSWSAIRDFGPERFRERLETLGPAIVFANEDEERILGGPLDGCEWVLKRGPLGARFGGLELPAVPAEVLDTTGAGDALAAGYLVGGAELALAAAARCVAKLGSMP